LYISNEKFYNYLLPEISERLEQEEYKIFDFHKIVSAIEETKIYHKHKIEAITNTRNKNWISKAKSLDRIHE